MKYDKIPVLSVCGPYPALIRAGLKTEETRAHNRIKYRGPVLIHETIKQWNTPSELTGVDLTGNPGHAYLIADLIDCIPITAEYINSLTPTQLATGFYTVGRYRYVLSNIREIQPIALSGKPYLFYATNIDITEV